MLIAVLLVFKFLELLYFLKIKFFLLFQMLEMQMCKYMHIYLRYASADNRDLSAVSLPFEYNH